jgi:predicted acetyltransferase
MPRLVPPTTGVRISFLEAMDEFRAEGRGGPDDDSMIAHEMQAFGPTWDTEPGFAAYVEQLLVDALEETPRPAHWVPSTTLWYVEGSDYLGRLAIRHRLTPMLLEMGGHIGYDVRPSARRRGHATAMLRAALPVARDLGIDPALVTCDTDNVGSRKVIEAGGGVLEDERHGKLRFWVPTAAGG